MTMQIETLLRPLPERRSALLSVALAAYLFFFSGEDAFMAPGVAVPASAFFMAWGLWRLWGYNRLKFYQTHLIASPRYEVKLSKVPALSKKDFYGKGFIWASKHVARLEEADAIANEKYLRKSLPVRLGDWLSLRCQQWSLNRLETLIASPAWWNPLRPLPEIGGKAQLHGVGLLDGEQDIFESTAERFGHREIIGTTRVGKSTAARALIYQDVMRGYPTVVIDPKGDPDLLRATYMAARDAGKLDRFIFFHLGFEETSARYSPLRNINRETEIAGITTSSLPGDGHAAAFKDFAWRYVNNIGTAMLALNEPITFKSILDYAKNIERLFGKYCEYWIEQTSPRYPAIRDTYEKEKARLKQKDNRNRNETDWPVTTVAYIRLLENIDARYPDAIDDVLRGLLSIVQHSRAHFQKLITNIYPLLEKLTTGNVGKILSPVEDLDGRHKRLDFRHVFKEDAIVYMGLDALSDVTVASTVCSVVCADIVSTLGEAYNHGMTPGVPERYREPIKPISLHADEANELMVSEFVPLVNKGGGSGLQVTIYTQSAADKEVKLGSKARSTQVSSNFNTQMYFRVRNRETALEFTSQLGEAQYNQSMIFTGTVDSPDPRSAVEFTSSTQQRLSPVKTDLVRPEDLINLPKGHAFLLTNGRLYKVRMPITTMDDTDMPEALKSVMGQMDSEYKTSENWFVDRWYHRQVEGLRDRDIDQLYGGETASTAVSIDTARARHRRSDDMQAVSAITGTEAAMLNDGLAQDADSIG